MKRTFLGLMILFLLTTTLSTIPVRANVGVGAVSAVLMDQDTGRVLYEKNPNKPMKIASITKIMTAILAIESGKMQKTVTVSKTAIQTEGSSLYLKEGEKRKLEDLVYGLMLRSGNDAANVIAEAVGGSIDGFVFLMNQKAKEIGMENTHFDNPSGLDTIPNQDPYSSAHDMALLTKYAMHNNTFQKISGTKFYKGWKNKNRLLTEKYKFTTGGKTGYTKRAKRTLVTTATKGNENLIVVTINDSNDWDDHINLYEYGFKHYTSTILLPKGPVETIKGKYYKDHVYVKSNVTYPLRNGEQSEISIKFNMIKPEKSWKETKYIPEIVGRANVYKGTDIIRTVPIYYQSEKYATAKNNIFAAFKKVVMLELGVNQNG